MLWFICMKVTDFAFILFSGYDNYPNTKINLPSVWLWLWWDYKVGLCFYRNWASTLNASAKQEMLDNSRSWILNLSVCVCEDVPDRQSTQGWLNKFVNVTHPMNPHSNTLDNFKRTCWSDAPRFPCFFVLMNYLPQSLLMSETYPDGAITHILNQQSLVLCRLGHSVMCCHVICEIKKKKNPEIASFTPHARQSRLNVTCVQSQRAARWRVECDI